MLKIFDLQMFAEESATLADSGSLATNTVDVADATSQSTTDTEGNSAESFDSLISGKYKSEYEAKVKSAIDKRFKNQKDFENKFKSAEPILMMMAERYGMDVSDMNQLDLNALTQQLEADNSMYEKEAFEQGVDISVVRERKRLERENRRLRQEKDAQLREAEGRARYEQLMREANEVRKLYPGFDIDVEMQNEGFGRLVATGIPMQTAYEVCHKDEILSASMQYATQQTATMMANSIKSGMNRPAENSSNSQGAAAFAEKDPKSFSKEDFEKIKREAEKGNKVYLR